MHTQTGAKRPSGQNRRLAKLHTFSHKVVNIINCSKSLTTFSVKHVQYEYLYIPFERKAAKIVSSV